MNDGAPTIAIVDDDQSVLESIEDLLRSVGCDVLLFASAAALLIPDSLHKIDCLITDICLPGMSGLELERRARQQRPELPVVLLTAHDGAWNQAQPIASSQPGRFLFRKPVDGKALIAAIQTALADTNRRDP